jgi:hypothetical protein
MFQNPLRHSQSNDPFEIMGKVEESQINAGAAQNPFQHSNELPGNDPSANIHHVDPHYVQDHIRSDGTHVDGYWRDGDGNTHHDLTVDEGGGYIQSNPDGIISNNLG